MRTILLLLFCGLMVTNLYAQLEPSYLEALKKKPESFVLDIMEQKKDGDIFKTNKHKRYELTLDGARIVTQKVYDTMSNVAYNKSITYHYDDSMDENITEIIQNNFQGESLKRILYTYDERAFLLLKEEQFDGDNKLLQTINHSFGACEDPSVTEGLSNDGGFTCSTEDFSNRASKRKTVKVYETGTLVKELRYKGDGTLSVTEITSYTDDWKIAKVAKTTSSGRGYETVYTYNEQGDRASTKASFVAFNYEYEYDEHGNWTTMLETTKVPGKRQVYTRTFNY